MNTFHLCFPSLKTGAVNRHLNNRACNRWFENCYTCLLPLFSWYVHLIYCQRNKNRNSWFNKEACGELETYFYFDQNSVDAHLKNFTESYSTLAHEYWSENDPLESLQLLQSLIFSTLTFFIVHYFSVLGVIFKVVLHPVIMWILVFRLGYRII